MDRPREPRRRHVWVDSSGGYQHPGLILAWRHDSTGWQAQVAVVHDGSVLVEWAAAATLHPIADDRWAQSPPP